MTSSKEHLGRRRRPHSHALASLGGAVPRLLLLQVVLELPDLPHGRVHLRAVPLGGPVHHRAVAGVQRGPSAEFVPQVDADGVVGPSPGGASAGDEELFPALPVERVEGGGGCGGPEMHQIPTSKSMATCKITYITIL